MSDLAAALETWADPAALYDGGVSAIVIEAAARRQLALEPVPCETCGGSGENDPPVDPVGNHIECPTCHGRGWLYPAETVGRIVHVLHFHQAGCDLDEFISEKAIAVLDALRALTDSVPAPEEAK